MKRPETSEEQTRAAFEFRFLTALTAHGGWLEGHLAEAASRIYLRRAGVDDWEEGAGPALERLEREGYLVKLGPRYRITVAGALRLHAYYELAAEAS